MIVRLSKLEMMNRRLTPFINRPFSREYSVSVQVSAKWRVLTKIIKEEFPDYYCIQGNTDRDLNVQTSIMTHELIKMKSAFDTRHPEYHGFTVTAYIGRAHPTSE